MVRDDRSDPNRRPLPNPRDLRASLSTSMGLGRRSVGEDERGASRGDATAQSSDDPPIAETDDGFEPSSPVDPSEPVAGPEPTAVPRRGGTGARGKAARRKKTSRPSEAEGGGRDIVPPQAIAGRALMLVVAIMGLLACLAVGTLSLIRDAARDWQLDVSREVTIQLKPIDATPIEPRLQKAMEIARATAGVRSARLIGEREGAMLLEPWLGSGLDLSSLPIPRLVVIELADPASADLAGLKARIGAEVRGATVDDHAVWAARLRTMASTMVVIGFVVVMLMFTAMVLSVVFATRAAMAGNRDVIEVLHFVGAEDRFIASQFQRHFLKLGLVGGAAGGAAAIVAFLVADFATRTRGDAFSDQAQALFGGFSVGWSGYLGAVAVVGLVAVLTALTSRFTVLGHLGRLD